MAGGEISGPRKCCDPRKLFGIILLITHLSTFVQAVLVGTVISGTDCAIPFRPGTTVAHLQLRIPYSNIVQLQEDLQTFIRARNKQNGSLLIDLDSLTVIQEPGKLANLMYKRTNNLAPAYLCNLFAPRTSTYDLRDAKGKLLLPKPRTDYLKRSFRYSGALLWNNLPEEIRTTTSLDLLREVLIDGFLNSTPTRQICKPVVENFLFIFYVRVIFLTVYK